MPPRIDFVPRPPPDRAPDSPQPGVGLDGQNLVIDAPDGAIVEALNATRAATGFDRVDDAVELGRAEHGRWVGAVPNAGEGDRLRVRARMPNGRVSSWVRTQIRSGGVDATAAFVNLDRIHLVNLGGGRVAINAASKRMPVTEDDAALRFTNARTGARLDTKATAELSLEEGLVIAADTDDELTVAVSDGAGNQDFSWIAGKLRVPPPVADVPEPGPLARDPDAVLQEIQGDLFANGVASPDDVKQGSIGNCYVPGALAAVAKVEPEAIDDMIQVVGRNKAMIRLYPGDGNRVDAPVFEPVKFQFYTRFGKLLYEQNPAGGLGDKMKLWVPLIGKAIAQRLGSYEIVAKGGSVGAMMSMILGRPNHEVWTNQNSVDDVWKALVKGREERRALAAGTYGVQENARYRGTGIYANHAYSIHGCYVNENGNRMVRLRNPWASGEPRWDGKDDGYFEEPIERFCQLFQVLNVC